MKEKISLKILHIILMILGTIFIFSTVFHSNIWFDEAYSVGMANHNLANIWNIGKNDVHPVLYYWMLRIVNILTNGSILAYRLFSTLPVAILGILGRTHIKKDFGEKTGILFSFLTYFLPIMSVYANQIRMYSWALLIVSVLAIYAYRIYMGQSNRKNWIIFGITSLASIYIHYYGLMAAGLINVFLLIHFIIKKRWKELKIQISLGIIQTIAYVPWLLALLGQMEHVSEGFWIEFTFPKIVYEIVGCQMNGTLNTENDLVVGFIANTLLFISLIIVGIKNRKDKELKLKPVMYSLIIYVAVILAAIVIEKILGAHILYYRYLFVITGLYIFAVSHILAKSNNKYLIPIVCIVVLVLGVYNCIIQIKDNYSLANNNPIEFFKENVQDGDTFVFNEAGSGFICATVFKENNHYFYNPEDWGVKEAYKAWAPQMETCMTTNFLKKCTGRIWVIGAWNNSCYEELFDNEDYKIISNQYFVTKYEDYIYNITLVESVEK